MKSRIRLRVTALAIISISTVGLLAPVDSEAKAPMHCDNVFTGLAAEECSSGFPPTQVVAYCGACGLPPLCAWVWGGWIAWCDHEY